MKAIVLSLFAVALFSTVLHAQFVEDADFRKADSVAELYPGHSLNDLRSLSNKLTQPLSTDVEKFRAIYYWVCLNIENDYTLYLINKRKKAKYYNDPEKLLAWNKQFSTIAFKTLQEKNRTVCTGYAYLVKELARYAGLSCQIIDGYGRTVEANIGGPGIVNHSWNAIQLNERWYLCDPTWSAGAYDTQLETYVKHFESAYFLADPELFVRNHYPLDTAWMFLKDKPTLSTFLNRPIVYSNAYRYAIHSMKGETLEITTTKGNKVSFEFTKGTKPFAKLQLRIKWPGGSQAIDTPFHADQPGHYTFEHVFTSKGKYAVHILLDGNYVFSYSAKVN